MKAPLLLRIAAVITFLYFAGHTAGMPWTPAVGPAEVPVLEAMKSHSFNAEGFTRTYWDFYFGFGGVIISACTTPMMMNRRVVIGYGELPARDRRL